jgi:hypothetical protein
LQDGLSCELLLHGHSVCVLARKGPRLSGKTGLPHSRTWWAWKRELWWLPGV